ncbi:MgtC family protein [Streptomyces sp. 2112.3]|nr:MgtC family protein [Streptomyces sp. 2112.3]
MLSSLSGFIGGGLIFVRKDAGRGLTTAATIWLTRAIGMACGGGLPLPATGVTAVRFLVVRGFSKLSDRIPSRPSYARIEPRINYRSEHRLLGNIGEICTGSGFRATEVQVETHTDEADPPAAVLLRLEQDASAGPLVEPLSEPAGAPRPVERRYAESGGTSPEAGAGVGAEGGWGGGWREGWRGGADARPMGSAPASPASGTRWSSGA